MGDDAYGINRDVVAGIVRDVAEVTQLGVEVGVVIGGGNIFRGMAGQAVRHGSRPPPTTWGCWPP